MANLQFLIHLKIMFPFVALRGEPKAVSKQRKSVSEFVFIRGSSWLESVLGGGLS
jgi:hypothetical protein